MGRIVKEYISGLFLGIGFILIISPSVLFWFIHGSYERYIWIINGPYPFSHFGGGPFQLFMYLGLFIMGVILIAISVALKER
jgi:hypothetical protein